MHLASASSALIGAAVGSLLTLLGTVIAAWAAARRERLSFERVHSQQHIDRVRDGYDFALNVLFNMKRGGSPDRATHGNVFARISLLGSPEVRHIVAVYLEAAPQDRSIDLARLIEAMKSHLHELETDQP